MTRNIINKVYFEQRGGDYDTSLDIMHCYLNKDTGEIMRNTEVYINNQLSVKINSIGCRGGEIISGIPVIGCFGDSTTFGVCNNSWPSLISIQNCQPINAGVEGHRMDRVINRVNELFVEENIDLIAAVIFTGWHNLFQPPMDEGDWEAYFDNIPEIPIVAHCTIPAALTELCLIDGAEGFIGTGSVENDTFFYRFDRWTMCRGSCTTLWRHLRRFNKFICDYCERRQRILIDFAALLNPRKYEDIPIDFFDICHMRQRTYKRMANLVSEKLKDAIYDELKKRGVKSPGVQQSRNEAGVVHNRSIYPLW
ncbi:MAG: hypothetical protein OEL53_01715 [Rhodospirillales bacterium]|nr:hypothetical protein [Rhodospirillales bacterium]